VKRAIAWFAENHVAANLVMAILIVGGVTTMFSITQKFFPDMDIDMVTIGVEYLGAAPEEVEEGVCIRIEEEIEGVEGIEKIQSTATEGAGAVFAELITGADVRKALDDIKNRVDAITTFPEETEKPVISNIVLRHAVIDVALSGQADERTLKVLGQRVRDEIAALPGVTQVELRFARPYEISIEVPEESLRRHSLTFDQVARAVRRSSLDLPGGSLKTAGGEILLRTKGQAYRGQEFEDIVVLTRSDGTRVTLGDVAHIVDGFEDIDVYARFDGAPTVLVQVFRVGDQDMIAISDRVKAYVAEARAWLPDGIELTVWQDSSRVLRDRLSTLIRNGRNGFLLVLMLLAIFLRPRLAFWTTIGVPVSFLGALWLMPAMDLSINVISLFAFILVLGILVDDAIVVGENVHTQEQQTGERLRSAIQGTQEVAIPVIFGVLTTVAAFVPMLLVPGPMGQAFSVIAWIVILCLMFSLIESQLVLPAHLGHGRSLGSVAELSLILVPISLILLFSVSPNVRVFLAVASLTAILLFLLYRTGELSRIAGRFMRMQANVASALARFVQEKYRPLLARALEWRYLTVAAGLALFLWTAGVIASGRMHFSFFPPVEADYVVALLTMPQGTPVEVTGEAVHHLEEAAGELRTELDAKFARAGQSQVRHVLASVGQQPFREHQSQGPGGSGRGLFGGAHLGEVILELAPGQERGISASNIAQRWREIAGAIPDAVELVFVSDLFSAGEAVNIQLQGPRIDHLRQAANRVKAELAEYPGVVDIADSFRAGKQELKLAILPSAEPLGLTMQDLARQVRQAFYGDEAQRIQRARDDVRVMVRYPQAQRRSLGDVESMRIRTPDGTEVPFSTVARAELGRGFAAIQRSDRQRVVNVTADVDRTQTTPNDVLAPLLATQLPEIIADYPGMSYSLEGEQREQRRALGGLLRTYVLALVAIYALLAVPLRSYFQPLLIMSVIPFGMIGAIGGHLLLGRSLSFFSVIGMVALSGVVVNSSLVLVDFVNRRRAEGVALDDAVRQASVARFRPIVLTSLSTFAGLTPLMLERSLQAQFLIPMAISLAFGVIFAAFITLFIVPSGYLMLEDLRLLQQRLLHSRPQPAPAQEPEAIPHTR
jgi:multidrug efflux pump subunit AcrB